MALGPAPPGAAVCAVKDGAHEIAASTATDAAIALLEIHRSRMSDSFISLTKHPGLTALPLLGCVIGCACQDFPAIGEFNRLAVNGFRPVPGKPAVNDDDGTGRERLLHIPALPEQR